MRFDFVLLVAGYVLSQFFRSFLPVLTNVLNRDIGADPADLSLAAGMWFLTFAAMQIPVGAALDRIGPRRTAVSLLLLGGGGGSLVFALAQAPWHITVAMGLIGVGCSPVLMASYYILARVFPAARFATLAALILAVGQSGNLAGSLPMALAVEAIGWRGSMFVMGALCVLIALGLQRWVIDPPPLEGGPTGSLLDVLRIRAVWPIYFMMLVAYAPAGGLRGLWAGPYFAEVFGSDATRIGIVTLIMGSAMILGSLVYGPADRILGTRKWVNVFGIGASLAICIVLTLVVPEHFWLAVLLFCGVGFALSNYPMIMAHGRAFFPPHLVGRGVTLINLCGIGGAGVGQVITGRIYDAAALRADLPWEAFTPIFFYYAVTLGAGLAVYLFVKDRTD
ncbi:membrane protein, putative [Pseudooceanicola batsensis HTCC2597]|uniref:Membrane protein, putative n=1 Tax=Pseudooceanicola batsensis (strain ATCC BAA-863 / DSM 15984 / KCTC 12145 / HTCC2597) TaxID=252305 RepID=A3TVW6_PSEBH|nr:MFS transporter [Pseudooceanicola batsensis]EAQ03762.1 membrane protein, putative [Pseudooceanicola batsensis HTCC2597]